MTNLSIEYLLIIVLSVGWALFITILSMKTLIKKSGVVLLLGAMLTIGSIVYAAATIPAGCETPGDCNALTPALQNVSLQDDLRLADDDGSNFVALQSAPVVAADTTWTLPAADGTTGQMLSTDGSGILSWVSAAAAGVMNFAGLSDTDFTGLATGALNYFDGTNWVDLPAGTAGQSLVMNAGADAPEWATGAATEDVEVVLDTVTSGLNGIINLPADMSDYEYVRIEVSDLGFNGAPRPHTFSGRLKVGSIANNRLFLYDEGAVDLHINFDSTGRVGTITSSDGNWQSATYRAIGIRAQKTVIDNVNTLVNDQANSGYFDIGDMRMQWGTVQSTADGNQTFSLPASFANNNYSIVLNRQGANLEPATGPNNLTATSFSVDRVDGITGSFTLHWQAMGMKP